MFLFLVTQYLNIPITCFLSPINCTKLSVVGSYVIYSSVIIVINNKMIRYVFYLSIIIIIAKVTAEDDATEDKLECSHNTKANVVQSIQCSKE